MVGDGTAELYDPVTRSFNFAGTTSCQFNEHDATSLPDGRILLTGGGGDSRCIEIYDPVGFKFSRVDDSRTGRRFGAATLLTDARCRARIFNPVRPAGPQTQSGSSELNAVASQGDMQQVRQANRGRG